MKRFTTIATPCGEMTAVADGEQLVSFEFPGRVMPLAGATRDDDLALFAALRAQLDAYFAGARRAFDLPLAPAGTEFQLACWTALRAIPYGETRSYAEQAHAIGRPRAIRAVGAANGANPIAIVVPCHRVLGKDGSLTGFGGGLPNKQRLLELEARVAGRQLALPLAPVSAASARASSPVLSASLATKT